MSGPGLCREDGRCSQEMTLILALQDSFHVLDAAGSGEILTVGLRLLERWPVKGCHKRGLLRVNDFQISY